MLRGNVVALRIYQLFQPVGTPFIVRSLSNPWHGGPRLPWTVVFHRSNPVKDFGKDCGGFLRIVGNEHCRFGGNDHNGILELALPGI